jgi:hypothetical protein
VHVAGQRGGECARARRHQHRALGPHEPDRLLLSTEAETHHYPHNSSTEPTSPHTANILLSEPPITEIPLRDLNPKLPNMVTTPNNYTLPAFTNRQANITTNPPCNLTSIPSKYDANDKYATTSFNSSNVNVSSASTKSKVTYSNQTTMKSPKTLVFSNQNVIHPISDNMPVPRRIHSPTPMEIIPVSIISSKTTRQRTPVKKLKMKVPKTLPLSAKGVRYDPEPIAYIPVTLDHPPLNPEYMLSPSKVNKRKTPKELSPRKQIMEYISIPINSQGSAIDLNAPQNSKSVRSTGPSAPRLSNVSIESMGPSPYASINPRKLRSQHVSPMLFARPELTYRLL